MVTARVRGGKISDAHNVYRLLTWVVPFIVGLTTAYFGVFLYLMGIIYVGIFYTVAVVLVREAFAKMFLS